MDRSVTRLTRHLSALLHSFKIDKHPKHITKENNIKNIKNLPQTLLSSNTTQCTENSAVKWFYT